MESSKLKIDLSKVRASDSVNVGEFVIKSTGSSLQFIKSGKVLLTITDDDLILNDVSIKSINQVLENHYNALKQLIEK